MQIKSGVTQEQLECVAGAYARHLYRDVLQLRLRAQLVIIFLCFLNPPCIFGFFMAGALLTALFVCFLAWAYSNNELQLIQTALVWWYIWVAAVYVINLALRALYCRRLAAHLKQYKEADATDAAPIPRSPHQYPLRWEKDEAGEHWQNLILFQAPARGLYALEMIIENYNGSLESPPDGACAVYTEEIPGDRIRYLAIYRLEQGNHWMATCLSNASGNPPEAWVSQLNGEVAA